MTISFPNLPPLPPYDSGGDPTTWFNWPPIGPDGNYEAYSLDGNGYMQVLMREITAIDAHPATSGNFLILAKTLFFLSQLKNPNGSHVLSDGDISFLNDTCNLGALLKDGIDYASQYAFLYGFGGYGPGTVGAFQAFANELQPLLAQIKGAGDDNKFIDAMSDEVNQILDPTFSGNFMKDHINQGQYTVDAFGHTVQVGDIIWVYEEDYVDSHGVLQQRKIVFDWTAAQNEHTADAQQGFNDPQWVTTTLQKITDSIENSAGAAGGPNPDIDTLDAALTKMQIIDALNTFFYILKETGDVGLAILAFIYEWEGYKMNSGLSGPADVMDKETQLSRWAKKIEDELKEIGNPGFDGEDVTEIVGNTLALVETIDESGQLSGGLGDAVAQLKETFETTMINFPPNQTATQRSLWDLMTDSTVSPLDLAKALHESLAPSPGAGSTDPGALALQGVLGGFDGIVTAVSSNSTAQVTTSQQMQSLIQALDKIMTGVSDPKTGMNVAVIANTINHQVTG